MTVQAFQDLRGLDQLARGLVLLEQFIELRLLLQGLFDRDPQFRRDQFGDLVDIGIRHSHNAAHVADRRARLHGPEGDDLRDVLRAVFLGHIINDLPAAFETKVDIDIRHPRAVGIQEPFKKQSIFERVQVRYP